MTFCSKRFNSPTRCFSFLFSPECCSFSANTRSRSYITFAMSSASGFPLSVISSICFCFRSIFPQTRQQVILKLVRDASFQVLAGLHLWVTSQTRANDSTEPHACLMPQSATDGSDTKRNLCSSVTGTFPLPHNKGYESACEIRTAQCAVCF